MVPALPTRPTTILSTTHSQELDLLEDGAKVYKLIGPVLMSQDLEDAKQNVTKRLDFIKGEMCVERSVMLTCASRIFYSSVQADHNRSFLWVGPWCAVLRSEKVDKVVLDKQKEQTEIGEKVGDARDHT